jgi:hypothetical protein
VLHWKKYRRIDIVNYSKILILYIQFFGFMHVTTKHQLDNCIIKINVILILLKKISDQMAANLLIIMVKIITGE